MILKNQLIYLNPRISLTDWQHLFVVDNKTQSEDEEGKEITTSLGLTSSESTSLITEETVCALLPSRIPLPPPPHRSFSSITKNVAYLRHVSIWIFIIIITFSLESLNSHNLKLHKLGCVHTATQLQWKVCQWYNIGSPERDEKVWNATFNMQTLNRLACRDAWFKSWLKHWLSWLRLLWLPLFPPKKFYNSSSLRPWLFLPH